MRYKYFIRLIKNGKLITQTLKDWARDNQHEFPKFGFTNNTSDIPTTHEIQDHLIRNHNFNRVVEGMNIYLERKRY